MTNKRLFLLALLTFPFSLAFSQSAANVDQLLAAETVTASKAAHFVLGAANLLPAPVPPAPPVRGAPPPPPPSAPETVAYDLAVQNGWVKIAASDPITLKDTAFLIMKAFDMKGGLLYTLFKNPRYAYRELVYRNIIQGRVEPATHVSGQSLLQIIDRTMSYIGGAQLSF